LTDEARMLTVLRPKMNKTQLKKFRTLLIEKRDEIEKSFLDKINKALVKIDDGTFGVCEECGEEISVKRLEARPETTLCIKCKEDQERMEKDFG
jgi:RNA polymerase-binding transcription factor DksA